MESLLKALKAAADPTRLRILRMLSVRPLCVCEVMEVLGMAQSTVSKHLIILAGAGLARSEPGGTWTVYRLAKPKASTPEALLLKLVLSSKAGELSAADASAVKRADRYSICSSRREAKPKDRGAKWPA